MWNNWGVSDHTPFISYVTLINQPIKCTSFILLYGCLWRNSYVFRKSQSAKLIHMLQKMKHWMFLYEDLNLYKTCYLLGYIQQHGLNGTSISLCFNFEFLLCNSLHRTHSLTNGKKYNTCNTYVTWFLILWYGIVLSVMIQCCIQL